MTRDATSAVLTAVTDPVVRLMVFVELDYPTGFVRVNSTDRDLSFDSGSGVVSFTGIGQLGSVSSVSETAELQASRISLTMTGIPAASISAAFEKAQGRPAKIWIGMLDATYTLIADPTLLFVGLMDNSNIDIGKSGIVTVHINNRFIEWQREKIRRYTNEDQQSEFPGDKFFEFVVQAVEKEVVWGPGGAEPRTASPPPPAAISPQRGYRKDRGERSGGSNDPPGGEGGAGGNDADGQGGGGGLGGPGDTGSGGLV